MSVDILAAVSETTSHLRALLNQARNIKAETHIEPPLQTTSLEPQLKDYAHALPQKPVKADQKKDDKKDNTDPLRGEILEQAARDILYTLVSDQSIDSAGFVAVWNLLDILSMGINCEIVHRTLVLRFIEELIDTQTLAGCRKIFEYMESRREILLRGPGGFAADKQIVLLRCCNELLRRLSRAEDAVFSGRVFVFLFQSYPLGDRSSVNLRGEFHVENVTTFDESVGKEAEEVGEKMEQDGDQEMKVEGTDANGDQDQEMKDASKDGDITKDQEMKDASTHGDNTNDQKTADPVKAGAQSKDQKDSKEEDIAPMELYPIFWSLQGVFSNPVSLIDEKSGPDPLAKFKSGLELTIKKFKALTQQPSAKMVSDDGLSVPSVNPRKRKRTSHPTPPTPTTSSSLSTTYNTKYLTTPTLFDLELQDLTFHRHICVQALILLDFLLSLTPRAKARLPFKPQKSLAYSFTLSPDDEKWATGMRRTIEGYLKGQRDGSYYYRMVDNVLSRDKNWARWKMQGCPVIERPPVSTATLLDAKKEATDRVAWKRLRALPMNAVDLGFLTTTLAAPAGESLPGVPTAATPAITAAPSTATLLTEVAGLDMDIDFLRPREGESFEERDAALAAEEAASKRPKREERARLLRERQAYRKERSALEARRAARTWRLLRLTARRQFGMLAHVREGEDVGLCDEERARAWVAEREREREEKARREAEAPAPAGEAGATEAPAPGAAADGEGEEGAVDEAAVEVADAPAADAGDAAPVDDTPQPPS